MSLRCRIGWHDWKPYDADYPSMVAEREFPDALWLHRSECLRCGVYHMRPIYRPKESDARGREVMYPGINGTGRDVPIYDGDGWDMTCVRPGTREHGTMRDGSKPVRSACGHLYRDHGSMRYVGHGKTGFRPGPCKDCSCEGFIG